MTVKDAANIYRWKQDEYVKLMALNPGFMSSLEEQASDIEQTINNDGSEYKMILLDDKPIGYIRIDFMDDLKEMTWLRFVLGEERGRGYMKRALLLYLESLFQRHVKRVEAEVYEYNKVSQNLLLSCGFIQEGTKRKAHFLNGKYYDIFAFGLLVEDFHQARP